MGFLFFTDGFKECIKKDFGSYSGAVLVIIAIFFAIHSAINCMLGFNKTFGEASRITTRYKMNYILSPVNYMLQEEGTSTIYLTQENVT